jgi:hypothetical protein
MLASEAVVYPYGQPLSDLEAERTVSSSTFGNGPIQASGGLIARSPISTRRREGEPKYDDLEKRLAQTPVITIPAITLEGDANGAPDPDAMHMQRNSQANMRTESSLAVSVTICLRKPPAPLPKLSSKLMLSNC